MRKETKSEALVRDIVAEGDKRRLAKEQANVIRKLPDYIYEAHKRNAEKLAAGLKGMAKEFFISGYLHGYWEAHIENGNIDDQDAQMPNDLLARLNNNYKSGNVRIIKSIGSDRK